MSWGDSETNRLKENIESQLNRLITQLSDIEELKEELDDDEYDQMKKETLDQMKEFENSLNKMISGNISLVDQIGTVQLAIQAAIRSSTSPEVLNHFLKKENGALRNRLADLEAEARLGRITHEIFAAQAKDILKMLEKLGEPLSEKEIELMNKDNLSGYEEVIDKIDSKVIVDASKEIEKANK